MWDRYDPRDDDRDRCGAWDRELGGRGSASDRDRDEERHPRDIFTKDLDLPRGSERRPVRSATGCTRSTEPGAARWRRSARFGSSPRAICTTSGTIPRTRGEGSRTSRRKG